MAKRYRPDERRPCPRCGVVRQVNLGRIASGKSQGLCRSCAMLAYYQRIREEQKERLRNAPRTRAEFEQFYEEEIKRQP